MFTNIQSQIYHSRQIASLSPVLMAPCFADKEPTLSLLYFPSSGPKCHFSLKNIIHTCIQPGCQDWLGPCHTISILMYFVGIVI